MSDKQQSTEDIQEDIQQKTGKVLSTIAGSTWFKIALFVGGAGYYVSDYEMLKKEVVTIGDRDNKRHQREMNHYEELSKQINNLELEIEETKINQAYQKGFTDAKMEDLEKFINYTQK